MIYTSSDYNRLYFSLFWPFEHPKITPLHSLKIWTLGWLSDSPTLQVSSSLVIFDTYIDHLPETLKHHFWTLLVTLSPTVYVRPSHLWSHPTFQSLEKQWFVNILTHASYSFSNTSSSIHTEIIYGHLDLHSIDHIIYMYSSPSPYLYFLP